MQKTRAKKVFNTLEWLVRDFNAATFHWIEAEEQIAFDKISSKFEVVRTDSSNLKTFLALVFYHIFGRFKRIYDRASQLFYRAGTMLLESIERTSLFSPSEFALFNALARSKYFYDGSECLWFTQSISLQPTPNTQKVVRIFQFQKIHRTFPLQVCESSVWK